MDNEQELRSMIRRLFAAGCVAADEEASEIWQAASGPQQREEMLARRETGEPLAWIVGSVQFCGIEILVDPGVYVPRWQSEPLARKAAQLLPERGIAVDLCTGSGAIAKVLQTMRPKAAVYGTESDPIAVACARRNGVVVFQGNLDESLPVEIAHHVDVMVGSLPYVPRDALYLLPRDVQAFEPSLALDGGIGGLEILERAITGSTRWLCRGGALLFEIGGEQVEKMHVLLQAADFQAIDVLVDEDSDDRAIYARYGN